MKMIRLTTCLTALWALHSLPAMAADVSWVLDVPLAAGDAKLDAFVREPHCSLKQRDALAMLERMTIETEGPPSPSVRVERTVFLQRLLDGLSLV